MKLSAKYLTMAICIVLATLMVAPEGTSIWGTPSADAQTVVSEAVQKDTTWTREGSPYIISNDIRVKGTDGDDGVTTLIIEAGAVIKFDRYRSLVVGTSEDEPGAHFRQPDPSEQRPPGPLPRRHGGHDHQRQSYRPHR